MRITCERERGERRLHAGGRDEVKSGAKDSVGNRRRVLVAERMEDASEDVEHGVELGEAA